MIKVLMGCAVLLGIMFVVSFYNFGPVYDVVDPEGARYERIVFLSKFVILDPPSSGRLRLLRIEGVETVYDEDIYTLRWQYSDGKGSTTSTLSVNSTGLNYQNMLFQKRSFLGTKMLYGRYFFRMVTAPMMNGCYDHYCSGW